MRRGSRDRNSPGEHDAPLYLVRFDHGPHPAAENFGGPRRQEMEWFRAVETGNIDLMDRLIQAGVEVNAENKDKMTALQVAIKNNNLKMLALLIKSKADLNQRIGIHKETPLIFAARYGRHECVRLLCQDPSVDVNVGDSGGMTAMAYSAQFNQINSMKALLEFHANINSRDDRGETPLSVAAFHGRMESVRFLVESGADLETIDSSGNSPIQDALDGGHVDCANFLRIKLAEFVSDKVWVAARDNDVKNLVMLLQSGRNADDMGIRGNRETALIWACRNGHAEAVQLLLRHHANVESIGLSKNYTPLFYAVEAKSMSCVHHLLNAGANWKAIASNGDTLLHVATRVEFADVVELLIERGLTPDTKNHLGETSLQLAQNATKKEYGQGSNNPLKSIIRHPKALWLTFSSIAQILARYHAKSRRFRQRYQFKDEVVQIYGNIIEFALDYKRSKPCALKFMSNFDEFQRQTKIYELGYFNKYTCVMSENFIDESIHSTHPYCIVIETGEESLKERQSRLLLEASEIKILTNEILQFSVILNQRGYGLLDVPLDHMQRFWDGSYRLLTLDAVVEFDKQIPDILEAVFSASPFDIKNRSTKVNSDICSWAYAAFFQNLVNQITRTVPKGKLSTGHSNTDDDEDEELYLLGVSCQEILKKIMPEKQKPRPSLTEIQLPDEIQAIFDAVSENSTLDRPRLVLLHPSRNLNWTIPTHQLKGAFLKLINQQCNRTWNSWLTYMEREGYFDIHFLCEATMHTVKTDQGYQAKEPRSFWNSVILLSSMILYWTSHRSDFVPFLIPEVFPSDSSKGEIVKEFVTNEFTDLRDFNDSRLKSPEIMQPLFAKALLGVKELDSFLERCDTYKRNGSLFPVETENGVRWYCLDHAKHSLGHKEKKLTEAIVVTKDTFHQEKSDMNMQLQQLHRQNEELQRQMEDEAERHKRKESDYEKEIETLRRLLNETEQQRDKVSSDLEGMQKQYEETGTQFQEIVAEKNQLKEQISTLTVKVEEDEQLKHNLEEQKLRISELEDTIAKKDRRIKALEEEAAKPPPPPPPPPPVAPPPPPPASKTCTLL